MSSTDLRSPAMIVSGINKIFDPDHEFKGLIERMDLERMDLMSTVY